MAGETGRFEHKMNQYKLLKNSQLYVILDKKVAEGKDLRQTALQTIAGGAQIIQYRDKLSDDREFLKNALELQKICKIKKVLFIINDRLEIAWYIRADGVHLGQNDLPLRIARKLIGKKKIIGGSAENLKQALEVQKEGADYVGVGPVFFTTTKEIEEPRGFSLLLSVIGKLRIPIFAIGGINLNNLEQVLNTGIRKVAVSSAILDSFDIKKTTQQFVEELKRS